MSSHSPRKSSMVCLRKTLTRRIRAAQGEGEGAKGMHWVSENGKRATGTHASDFGSYSRRKSRPSIKGPPGSGLWDHANSHRGGTRHIALDKFGSGAIMHHASCIIARNRLRCEPLYHCCLLREARKKYHWQRQFRLRDISMGPIVDSRGTVTAFRFHD